MLRTCNTLRITSLPVLRKDGAPGRRTTRTAPGRKTGAWTWVLGLDCFARLAMTGLGFARPGALRRT
ncbi:MAG: hypothetical protein LBM98_10235 [Oscillospiraceae bacterium]|nr:hypothetical protein [Oscillospiraceae bacterium]